MILHDSSKFRFNAHLLSLEVSSQVPGDLLRLAFHSSRSFPVECSCVHYVHVLFRQALIELCATFGALSRPLCRPWVNLDLVIKARRDLLAACLSTLFIIFPTCHLFENVGLRPLIHILGWNSTFIHLLALHTSYLLALYTSYLLALHTLTSHDSIHHHLTCFILPISFPPAGFPLYFFIPRSPVLPLFHFDVLLFQVFSLCLSCNFIVYLR